MIPELRHRWLPVLLTFALFPNQDRAEVSATVPGAQTFSSLVMTIGDGPDPVPTGVWQRFREVPLAWVLNADGFVRGDGPPDIVGNGGSGLPAVVWAWHTGSDHDIACSEWTGTQWSPATFLTSGLEDELDPRAFVETDGTLHVTWWSRGDPDRVFVSSRPPNLSWSVPFEVTSPGGSGSRPSVAVHQQVMRIAYERSGSAPGVIQEIVVATRHEDGTFTHEVVAQTARTARLDPILHVERGMLWLDWKQDDTHFGCSRWSTSGWQAPGTEPWSSGTWVGVEDLRRTIRKSMLAPQ